jgi:hypothetical protein
VAWNALDPGPRRSDKPHIPDAPIKRFDFAAGSGAP